MKKISLLFILVISFVFAGCSLIQKEATENNNQPAEIEIIEDEPIGMANPASVNCEEKGGTVEIITATDGSQSGICKFNDGSECEEWAFFRGECVSGNLNNQNKVYKNQELGFELELPSGWVAIRINEMTGADDIKGNKVVFWNRSDYKDFFIPESEGIKDGVYSLNVGYQDNNREEYLKDPSIKLLSSQPVVVDGISGTKDEFSGPYGNWTTIYLYKEGVVYSITSSAKKAEEIGVTNQIISSFEFIK